MPRQVRPFAHMRELQTKRADVFLQRAIAVDAHFAADFGVLLLTDLDFLRLAHQRELALAGHWIGRAAGTRRDRDRENQKGATHDRRFTPGSLRTARASLAAGRSRLQARERAADEGDRRR